MTKARYKTVMYFHFVLLGHLFLEPGLHAVRKLEQPLEGSYGEEQRSPAHRASTELPDEPSLWSSAQTADISAKQMLILRH